MKTRKAFTLVELLVVVAILALLLAMVIPSLGKAKDHARKALCAAQLHAYGAHIQSYVATYRTYPRMGVSNWGDPVYAKFYAVMALAGVPPTQVFDARAFYDGLNFNQVWDKALCPAMDAAGIWAQAAQAGGCVPQAKPDACPAAIGYQWNVCLRGREPRTTPEVPEGRYAPTPQKIFSMSPYKLTDWIWWPIHTRNNDWWIAQALTPDEVQNPAHCAEAWDSPDLFTVPREVYWGSSASDWTACYRENLVPGWNTGPQTYDGDGWAMLPADRHAVGNGSPNVLYADGSARADLTRRLAPADLPGIDSRLPANNRRIALMSWDDYHPVLGTTGHVLPRKDAAP